MLAGEIERTGWWGAGKPAGWADAVEAARAVLAAVGLPAGRVAVRAAQRAPWHPGRCAEVLVDDTVVGYAGKLHPATVEALELPRRTSAMELDLELLPPTPVPSAPRISGFPPALIDVALVVPEEVAAADVQRALADGAGTCWSRSGCSTCTPRRSSGRDAGRWRTSSPSGRRTGP